MTKVSRFFIAVIGVALIFAMTSPVSAQMVCGKRDTVLSSLANEYKEHPVSMGLANNGSVLEVLASTAGSWTVVLTRPDGMSCMLATGEGFENVSKLVKGPKV